MTRINYDCSNEPTQPGYYGGSMCMCRKCKEKRMDKLHCGACMKEFEDTKKLSEHIENCPAAEAMLFPINKTWLIGESGPGHPVGSLIYLIHQHAYLIKRYAHSIADGVISSIERAKIHYELCEKLRLEYKKFKPFEADKVVKYPSREEAERIIWEALGEELRKVK